MRFLVVNLAVVSGKSCRERGIIVDTKAEVSSLLSGQIVRSQVPYTPEHPPHNAASPGSANSPWYVELRS